MKSFQMLALAATALFTASGASPIDKRGNCSPNGLPDCLNGYNFSYHNETFDDIQATPTGTPITKYDALNLVGFAAAAAPTAAPHVNPPPHLTPQSGRNYLRAKESSGAFNSTRISTDAAVFKFKSFYFGCSRYADWTPIPCTLNVTGYDPSLSPPRAVNSVSIPYLYGAPGPNGQAPLQRVDEAQLKGLSVANQYVLATSGQKGTRPRLVLDNVDIVAYTYFH